MQKCHISKRLSEDSFCDGSTIDVCDRAEVNSDPHYSIVYIAVN